MDSSVAHHQELKTQLSSIGSVHHQSGEIQILAADGPPRQESIYNEYLNNQSLSKVQRFNEAANTQRLKDKFLPLLINRKPTNFFNALSSSQQQPALTARQISGQEALQDLFQRTRRRHRHNMSMDLDHLKMQETGGPISPWATEQEPLTTRKEPDVAVTGKPAGVFDRRTVFRNIPDHDRMRLYKRLSLASSLHPDSSHCLLNTTLD